MRRFLSIFLVLVLLFSFLALPASAVSAEAVAVSVDGLAAVSAIISGCGLTLDSLENFDSWNSVVSAASNFLSAENIIDAAGKILALKQGSKVYFPASTVQSIKDWLFSSSTVSSPCSGYSFYVSLNPGLYATYTVTSSSAPVYLLQYSFSQDSWSYAYTVLVSTAPFGHDINGSDSRSAKQAGAGYYYSTPHTWASRDINSFTSNYFYYPSGYYWWDYVDSLYNSGFFLSPSGIVQQSVSLVNGLSISDNFKDWAAQAISYAPITLGGTLEDEPISYLPVTVPSYSTSAPSLPLTQTEVWTGKDLTSSGTDTDDEEQVIPITPDLSEPVNSILELIVQIAADILAIKNAVVSWFTETWAAFTSLLMETLTAIKEAVIALPGLIVAAIEAVAATVTSILEWLKEVLGLTLQQILEALTAIKAWALGLVDALIAALSALLTEIFGVDIAAVQAAVAELRAEFPFFDSIIATGEFLYNGISSGEPPVIYAHLQNAEGSYSWGGTVAVLDMSFYARYKSTGDAIISAALYAFFGWRTFVRLPGIISGAGSDIKEVTNHYDI